MIYKMLIVAAALFGLYRLGKTKDFFARLVTIGLVTGIGLTFFYPILIKSAGLIVSMLAMVGAILYGLLKKDFTTGKRLLIISPTALVLLFHTFQFESLPGTGLLGYFQVIPVLFFLYVVLKDRATFKNEIGFLAIITIAALNAFVIQLVTHLK